MLSLVLKLDVLPSFSFHNILRVRWSIAFDLRKNNKKTPVKCCSPLIIRDITPVIDKNILGKLCREFERRQWRFFWN